MGASQVAEEIWAVVNALEIEHTQSAVSDRVTISSGIACINPALNMSPTVLIAAADAALYKAKAAGRNTYFPKMSTP
jgi:diguanylate cyclase (GGDEF)-like protein